MNPTEHAKQFNAVKSTRWVPLDGGDKASGKDLIRRVIACGEGDIVSGAAKLYGRKRGEQVRIDGRFYRRA